MTQANAKWMVILPPEGAARQVGEKAWETLSAQIPAADRKLFDTKTYLAAFDRLLKDPADEMVLETAVNGNADRLVTFNTRHLADAAADFGIRVLRPGEASKEVQRHEKK